MTFRFTSSYLFRAIAIISILLAVCFHFDREEEAPSQVTGLLAGNDGVDLSHIEAFGQGRHLECHDPEVMRYLEGCLAASTHSSWVLPQTEQELRDHSGYFSYYVRFGLDNGQECTLFCDVSNRDFCLLVPSHPPADQIGEPNRRAHFPQPVPAKLAELLAALTTEDYYD